MADGINKLNYVQKAEDVIKNLDADNKGVILLNTNQIRNILTLINELYASVSRRHSEELDEDTMSRIAYVRMKLIYMAGRNEDNHVREFLEKSHLNDYLDKIGNSKEKLMLVCHYTEALVAYHKFITKERS